MSADTKMRQTTSDENMVAVREYQKRHPDMGLFNGITYAALSEKHGGCIHVIGRGFFVPRKRGRK